MPRLRMEQLSTEWVELIHAFCRDLALLGLTIKNYDDGSFVLERALPQEAKELETFWRTAHAHKHALGLAPHREWVADFERRNSDCFADMHVFQSDVVSPELEIADFSNPTHMDLLNYLAHSQSVRSRKLVGKRVGLLIWDAGQSTRRPLIGGALLASPRFSQPLRDRYLGWPVDVQRNRVGHNPQQRAVRQAGLERMMQLAVAVALPPYSSLRGARLAALAPLTSEGFQAFLRASVKKDDADLAALVTTTGLSVTGTPFQRHRIAQLCDKGVKSAKDAAGDLYLRVRPLDGEARPYSSFKGLLSEETLQRAQGLYDAHHPGKNGSEAMAVAYALRRLRLFKNVFDGNEMGVHLAMLGERTRDQLEAGTRRPDSDRVLLDWTRCVAVWKRGFLPTPEGEKEIAKKKTRVAHARARERRLEAAASVGANDILLSNRVSEEAIPDRAVDNVSVPGGSQRSLSSPRKAQ